MMSAFVCDDGQLHQLAETASVERLRDASWIDLLAAGRDEIDRVQQATGLHVPTEAELSEIEILQPSRHPQRRALSQHAAGQHA